MVQLLRIDNGQVTFLPVDPLAGWSDTSFTSTAVNNFPRGPALVTVFANGIPSDSKYLVASEPASMVATPVISPGGGSFRKNVEVHISCATPGAVIHYATGGSTPTSSSPVYTTSFRLTGKGTKVVKAIAQESGYMDSSVATAIYTLRK